MSRPAKNIRLWKNGNVFYYRLPGMRNWKTTGKRNRTDAHNFAADKFKEYNPEVEQARPVPKGRRLRDFLDPYFVWDTCPRIADRRLEGKRISPDHAKHQRRLLKTYVFKDPIADKSTRSLTVGDVKDFRLRLSKKTGPRTVNAVLTALKTCFNDGVDRGTLAFNPTRGVGSISYQKRESGTFTPAEIAELFPDDGLGPWKDLQDYTAFLVAAACGLRRSEILALQWRDVDFKERSLHVEHAWREDGTLSEPKWGQRRVVPLPKKTAQKLKELRAASLYVLPDSLVFHGVKGERRGATWFQGRFRRAMKEAKIDTAGRRLTAHSFRHSLNTTLRDQGVPDEKIRAAMGWSNPGTQATYTHWDVRHLREQADLVDKLFREKGA